MVYLANSEVSQFNIAKNNTISWESNSVCWFAQTIWRASMRHHAEKNVGRLGTEMPQQTMYQLCNWPLWWWRWLGTENPKPPNNYSIELDDRWWRKRDGDSLTRAFARKVCWKRPRMHNQPGNSMESLWGFIYWGGIFACEEHYAEHQENDFNRRNRQIYVIIQYLMEMVAKKIQLTSKGLPYIGR